MQPTHSKTTVEPNLSYRCQEYRHVLSPEYGIVYCMSRMEMLSLRLH